MGCITNCTNDIPQRYDVGGCAPEVRSFGSDKFILVKCGTVFNDINDAAEWQAKITAGDVVVGPSFGNFGFGETAPSTFQDGCGNNHVEFSTTSFTFSTAQTANNYSDEDWYYEFNKNHKGYNLIPITCEGRLYLDDKTVALIKAATGAAVPVTNPGLSFSITSPPKFGEGPNGLGNAGLWSFSGEFKHKEMFRTVEIAGIEALI